MKRIFGRVLVKETNVGIPDLVIAVFDVDSTVSSVVQPTTLTAAPANTDLSPALLSSLHNRLGSILTDASGNFDLPISDETAVHYGKDQVPDLVVAVFAPEDSYDGSPIPRPAEQRLLYLSRTPRVKAGPVEAYLIRISQAQLDSFGIPIVASGNSVSDEVALLAAGLERQLSVRSQLNERLAPVLQTKVDRTLAIRSEAKAIFANLSSIPPGLREYPYLVKDPRDAATTKQIHTAAIQAGLDRLAGYGGTFVLRLRDDELAGLGLQKDDTGAVSGKVDPAVIAERLLASSSGPDLVRTRTILDANVSAEAVLAAAQADAAGTTVANGKSNGKPLS